MELLLIGASLGFVLWQISQIKSRLDRLESSGPVADSIKFFVTTDGNKIPVEGKMFLKVSQNLPLSIEIKDKFGNAAKVDGAPAWALTDASLASLDVAADGTSALVKPAGIVGTFKVQVSADADLGEGVKAILAELEIELLPGEAVSVAIAAGTPADQ